MTKVWYTQILVPTETVFESFQSEADIPTADERVVMFAVCLFLVLYAPLFRGTHGAPRSVLFSVPTVEMPCAMKLRNSAGQLKKRRKPGMAP